MCLCQGQKAVVREAKDTGAECMMGRARKVLQVTRRHVNRLLPASLFKMSGLF